MKTLFIITASATSFQCNLLFGTHPATKHLTTSNKFKKLPTLEDKLRFILDDFESSRPNGKYKKFSLPVVFAVDLFR